MENIVNNSEKYHEFRNQYPFLEYESFQIIKQKKNVELLFRYNLSEQHFFEHSIVFENILPLSVLQPDDPLLHNIVFHIGLIECINYWKTACPQVIISKPGFLSDNQILWWKDFFFHGLGEFFYRNGIEAEFLNFLEILPETFEQSPSHVFETYNSIIVPIGGGKDSAVTLSLLQKAGYPITCMAVNPTKAIEKTIALAELPPERILRIKRKLDPNILKMNEEGFLNGHVPITAILSFISTYAALLTGHGNIAFSNESSASEPTVKDTHINHQYSKSWRFERDFRNYIQNHISKELEYFSFLRPLNEMQISKIFAENSVYHADFRSCNVGSKTKGNWCGSCPKCLFTWIILSPFMSSDQLVAIFGKNLFADKTLTKTMDELTGVGHLKPFECVGTIREVNIALCDCIRKFEGELPALLEHYKASPQYEMHKDYDTNHYLEYVFDNRHFLPEGFEKTLKDAIRISRYP